MESDEVTAPLFSDKDESGEKSISEVLDALCVYYMMLGVPEKEFWDGDYTRLKYYVRKHNYEVEERNMNMWLQGLYNYEAFSVVMAKAFGKGSGRNINYPDKPHRLTPLSPEEQEAENKRQVEEFRRQLDLAGRRFNEKKKREKERADKLLAKQGGENLGCRKPDI